MSLTQKVQDELLNRGFTRRQIGRISLGAAAVFLSSTEFAFAAGRWCAVRSTRPRNAQPRTYDPDAVRITSNENPMGPSKEGLEAIAHVAPLAWRYGPMGD